MKINECPTVLITACKPVVVILFSYLCLNVAAQDIPEPDFSQKPYYYKDGKLNALENQDGIQKIKPKGMGYGGAEIVYEVPGINSPVRLSSSSLRIIIKNEGSTDPSESFILVSGEIKKDTRRFKTGKVAGMVRSNTTDDNRVKIHAKKVRDNVFEILSDAAIPPGEYALIPYIKEAGIVAAAGNAPLKMYCFGID